MINPTDFHKTAEFLKEQKDEWNVRTSVNRSYYGAFLYFREFLAGQKVDIPKPELKTSQHQFIIKCFKESITAARNKELKDKINVEAINTIYSRLKTLFQDRINADYILRLRFPPSYSEDSLKRAKTAIQDFENLSGSLTEKLVVNTAKRRAEQIRLQATSNP